MFNFIICSNQNNGLQTTKQKEQILNIQKQLIK